jgi:hypothetical protein
MHRTIRKSSGLLNLRHNALVVEVDPELHRYYFNQLKNNVSGRLNKPLFDPHITIFGSKENRLPFLSPIKENTIEFYYDHDIRFHDGYYYLQVIDNANFTHLRISHGLNPVYDEVKGFHITIANNK